MKLLLTGATGFLGFRTLERLAEMDEVVSVIATGRSIKETHKIDHPKVKYLLGDLSDAQFVNELVKNVDYVIHAAALSSPWGKYTDFEAANVQSQINLINALKNCNLKRFVYVSTPSIYFDTTNRLNIRETDPLPALFINAYSETKRLAEIELEKSGIPYVILRPRALTGRGDTVIMPRIIRAHDEGRLKIVGNGDNMVDLTSVENVVQAILLSLTADEKAVNQTYNITNGEPVNLWEKITFVLNLMGKELPQKKIPYSVVLMVAQLMEWKSKITNGKEPTLTKYGVGILAKSMTMDISKAKDLLGYNPLVSTDESIIEFVNWYIEHEKN